MQRVQALGETAHDQNTIEDGRLPRLRQEAVKAIEGCSAEKLSAILSEVDNPRLLDAPSSADDWPDTLLEVAIREEAVNCVGVLLKSGADPTQSRFSTGFTALHALACHANKMAEKSMRELVTMLLGAGADLNAKERHSNPDWVWSPLHYAIYNGSTKLAQILIEAGAAVDPRLLRDAEMEDKVIPDPVEDHHAQSVETLRLVRSLAIERSILTAMPTEPEAGSKPSPGMTL